MPNNTIAVERPDLLGGYYAEHPNHMTSVRQLPVMTSFWTWPGDNAIRIQDTIETHLQAVATLRKTPAAAMADIMRDLRALLPPA